MGKGDRKTAKGKRFNSSYGNVRRRKVAAPALQVATAAASTPGSKTVVKKMVLKKAAG